jgi:hypothetical protein
MDVLAGPERESGKEYESKLEKGAMLTTKYTGHTEGGRGFEARKRV